MRHASPLIRNQPAVDWSRSMKGRLLLVQYVLLCAGSLIAGCTREEEAKHPVSLDVAREAGARLVSSESKVPVRDDRGDTHEASSVQLTFVWDDGRTSFVTACLPRTVGAEVRPAPSECSHPPPSRAEVTYLKTVPNWPAIALGAVGAAALAGNIGCFAAWCDSNGRTAVAVTDGVVLAVVLVGGVILFVDVLKAATRD